MPPYFVPKWGARFCRSVPNVDALHQSSDRVANDAVEKNLQAAFKIRPRALRSNGLDNEECDNARHEQEEDFESDRVYLRKHVHTVSPSGVDRLDWRLC